MTARRVLVVAAHPDDEVLGCGGTVARHVAEGDIVQALILAEGATSRGAARGSRPGREQTDDLASAARAAARALGCREPILNGFPDNRMDELTFLDIVKVVETYIGEIKPQIVYTHHAGDLNIDHRLTHQAVLTACRPLPGAGVRAIYAFETPSSTGWNDPNTLAVFRPSRYVDIGRHLKAKAAALESYVQEMRAFPHARSKEAVEALAEWRGASVGCAAAEAFEVVREIV